MFLMQLIFAGILLGSLYALVGIGLNLPYQVRHVIPFSQGPFLMFTVLSIIWIIGFGIPLWLGLILGLILISLLALIQERLVIRPVVTREGSHSWVVATLGVGLVCQGFASKVWGVRAAGFPSIIFSSTDFIEVFQIRISLQMLLILFAVLAIIIIYQVAVHKTLWGKMMKAVMTDPQVAQLYGIKVNRIIIVSFVLSGLLAGIAGILIAPITGVNPAFGMDLMLKGFVALIIGGIGSVPGILLGGVILGLTELLVSGFLGSAFRNVVAFGLLIIMLSIRPYGLFGERPVGKI